MANIIDVISQQIIDSSQELREETEGYIDRAFSTVFQTTIPTVQFYNGMTTLDIDETYKNLPDPQLYNINNDLRVDFENKYNDTVSLLRTRIPLEFNNFINSFYPNTKENWDDLQTFLLDNLNGDNIGISKEVEQRMWDQAKERDNFDAKRAEKIVLKSASKRGTSYLQPSVNFSIIQAKNDAIRNQSGTNRQIAIDSAKIKVDFVKTTMATIIESQKTAINSSLAYLENVLSSYTTANNKARDYVGSYSTYYQSIDTYYNSLAKLSDIRLKAKGMVYDNRLQYYKENLNHINQSRERNSKIALTSAQIMGSQASSAMSGLNVLAGYGNITS